MENQQQSSDKRIWDVGNIIGCYKITKIISLQKFEVECIKCGKKQILSRTTISKSNQNRGCKYCRIDGHSIHYPGEIVGLVYKLIKPIRSSLWHVKCVKCGREQDININTMKSKKIAACYFCTHPEAKERPKYHTKTLKFMPIDERMYNSYKSNMEKNVRNGKEYRKFNLTLDQYKTLIHSNCYYCGAKPTADNQWNKSNRRKGDPTIVYVNGIDRIDSTKEYTIDNCVACCPICNSMKSTLSTSEFKSHIKRIYQKMFNDQSKDVGLSNSEIGDIHNNG